VSYTPIKGSTGFEMGHIDVIPSAKRNNASIAATPHTGVYSLAVRSTSSSSYGYAQIDISDVSNEVYLSCWINPYYTSSNYYLEFGVYGGGQWVGLRYVTDHWNAYVNGVAVATGSATHTMSEWHRVALHVIIDNSGTIESKIDGVADISYSGDTYDAGSSDITAVHFYVDGPSFTTTPYSYFDDFIVATGDWPGDLRFATALVPDGDTAQLDWTPSAGSVNSDLVDDIPPNDAEYVSAGSVGYKDRYTLSSWTAGTNESPVFIVDWLRVKKETADATMIRSVIKSGSTESSGGSLDLTTTYAYYSRLLDNDPDTAAEWTESAINALEIGQEYL